jgi:hypothetical protein
VKRLVIALIALLCAVPASAAISRVGSCAAQATSCTFSVAPSAGDAIVVFAHKDGATTNPLPPTTALTSPAATVALYATLAKGGANVNAAILGVRISDGTETTTGTWSGATSIAAVIYRGANVAPMGNSSSGGASSATLSYGTFTLDKTNGTSWVVGFAAHVSATNVTAAPTNMTLVASATDIVVSDTNAAVSAWTTQTTGVNASAGWRTYTIELLAQTGEDTTKLYVDDYVHMNVVDANTTALSNTVMASGTNGADTTYATFSNNVADVPPAGPVGFQVNNHFINAPAPVRVRSTVTDFAIGSTTRGMYYDNSVHFTSVQSTGLFSRRRGAVVVSGYITLGAPNDGVSSDLYDLVRVDTADGPFCVMQLTNGDGGTGYHLRIESNPGGTTRQSANITPTPTSTYWYSLSCNYQAQTAKLALYNTSGVQVGSTVTGSLAYTSTEISNGAYIDIVKWGNLETKTDAGSTNKFEHLLIDYSAALFPLGPAVTGGGGGGATCSPKISILGVSGCLSQTPPFPITPSTGAK